MTSLEACRLNLKERITQDQKSHLILIQYDVAREIPVFDAYRNFVRTFGDMMTYADFDFWFHRFANGMFDMDYDRSSDPKQLELLDMPTEILMSVLGCLSWKDRCLVRKVCRTLQDVVDGSKQRFKKIHLCIHQERPGLLVEDQYARYSVQYSKHDKGVGVSMNEGREKIINEKSSWSVAQNDFINILKWPKVEINKLQIYFGIFGETERRVDGALHGALSKINHKIHVEELNLLIFQHDDIFNILPFLKPIILHRLELDSCNRNRIRIDELAELEQWKGATLIDVDDAECNGVNNLFKLMRFHAHLPSISRDDFMQLKNAFHASSCFRLGDINIADAASVETVRGETELDTRITEDNLEYSFTESTISIRKIIGLWDV